MRSKLKGELRLIGWYFLAWTVVGIFFFSQGLVQRAATHDPTPWWHYLVTWMTGVYLCAAMTPLIAWAASRFPMERKKRLRRIAVHVAFSFVLSVGELAIHAVILRWLGLFPAVMTSIAATFGLLLTIGLHQNMITYWSILGVIYGVRLYRRYQEREKEALRLELNASELRTQLMRAQLGALKTQLQPHFLFNTLNAIMVLVRQQKTQDAEETLVRLSDLLRCVLDDVEAQQVPLRRELEYVELYLAIEQVRFRDRLCVETAVDPAVLDAAVPHMALQPIIENAIRHGVGKSSTAGRIEIRAVRIDGSLEIQVRDDGPGIMPNPPGQSRGIGLTNTRARLEQLYGTAAGLSLENGPNGGAVARLVLPYCEMPLTDSPGLVETHATENAAG